MSKEFGHDALDLFPSEKDEKKEKVGRIFLPPKNRADLEAALIAKEKEYNDAIAKGDPIKANDVLMSVQEMSTEFSLTHPIGETDLDDFDLKRLADFLNKNLHEKDSEKRH